MMITYKANKLIMITITHISYGILSYDSKENYSVLRVYVQKSLLSTYTLYVQCIAAYTLSTV